MEPYNNHAERDYALRALADTMQRSFNSPALKDLGVELALILDTPVAPPECMHNPDVQLDPPEYFDHFMHCLAPALQQEQLEEWRKAAHKWWDHQALEAQKRAVEPERALPGDGDVIGGTTYHTSEPKDMYVLVVLPGGNILALADSQPLSPEILATVSERDKRIMRTLLLAASDELLGQYDYGYSYGAQLPVPVAPPAPPQAWGPFGGTL
jgi:hypothetical protein